MEDQTTRKRTTTRRVERQQHAVIPTMGKHSPFRPASCRQIHVQLLTPHSTITYPEACREYPKQSYSNRYSVYSCIEPRRIIGLHIAAADDWLLAVRILDCRSVTRQHSPAVLAACFKYCSFRKWRANGVRGLREVVWVVHVHHAWFQPF